MTAPPADTRPACALPLTRRPPRGPARAPSRRPGPAAEPVVEQRLAAAGAERADQRGAAPARGLRRPARWPVVGPGLGRSGVSAFRLVSAARSDRGCVRPVSEDSYLARPDLGLWAVADGMGGHTPGRLRQPLVTDRLGAIPPPEDAPRPAARGRGDARRLSRGAERARRRGPDLRRDDRRAACLRCPLRLRVGGRQPHLPQARRARCSS